MAKRTHYRIAAPGRFCSHAERNVNRGVPRLGMASKARMRVCEQAHEPAALGWQRTQVDGFTLAPPLSN